jgi:RNA polymerase sigma factor (sigma-70 family)
MPDRLLRQLIDHLRAVVGPAAADALTDGELLDRYRLGRDEAAFELLVRRHGSLVLGVCRRVLRDAHLAEDAFQATFLILARKMRSVRRRATLAGWLYRVALRVALRARRGRDRSPPLAEEPAVEEPDLLAWRDLRPVLDEELARLPERLRLPVLLCYVEGHTTAQAARLLGCPRGTILSRLATARARLRDRLVRRGVELSLAGLAVGLAEQTVTAALVVAAVKSATGKAAPVGTIHLAQGALHAMFMNKLVCTLGAVVMAGALTFAVGRVASEVPGEREAPQAATTPGAVQPQAERPKAEDPAALLDRAKKELLIREERLQKVEERLSQELTEARLKLLELEEGLRSYERQWVILTDLRRRNREATEKLGAAKAVESQQDVERLTSQIREMKNKSSGTEAQKTLLARLEQELIQAQTNLARELERTKEVRFDLVNAEEHKHAIELLDRRKGILIAEEKLRLLERRAARETDHAQTAVEAAAARVRQLEGLDPTPEPSGRPNTDLQRKLDDLLREVSDLKREVKRLREGK